MSAPEPRQREDVDGWLHSEKRVPRDGGDHENRTNDVQVDLGLRVAASEQTQLERSLNVSRVPLKLIKSVRTAETS